MAKLAEIPYRESLRCASRGVAMAAVAFALEVAASSFTWTNNVVNTPATAYDWNDGGNWQQGSAPGVHDSVTLPSKAVYVRLPEDGAVVDYFRSGSAYCFGDSRLCIQGVSGGSRPSFAGKIFADLEIDKGDGSVVWLTDSDIAGRIIVTNGEFIPAGGTVSHRLDWYAHSSNPLRTDDVQLPANGLYHPGSARPGIYAPRGADACSGAWALTEGSPFLKRVSSPAHALAVGTIVSGTGIPEGTFLKRMFTDGMIELSAAATSTIASNIVSFAAFTPDVRIHVPKLARQGVGNTSFKLYKYREQDGLRFEADANTWDNNEIDNIGLTASEADTYFPGTIVIHSVSTGTGNVINFQNSHIELAGKADGSATTFGEKVGVSISSASCKARITVTNNIAGVISVFTNFQGTLVKDGGGTLTVGFGEAENNGTLNVEGGTFVMTARATVGTGPVILGGLSVSAGATLVLPECGVSVDVTKTSIDPAAVISGGRLRIVGGSVDNYVHNPGEGEVAGHPMFWLDASKTNTMTLSYESDGIYLTRWNDCREGEPMFCTNMIRRPRLVWGDMMTNRYVKLTRIADTTLHTNTEALVWSVPVGGIKAVFLVQDPSDGGGEILGRTMRLPHNQYYGSQGGPYYRVWNNISYSLVSKDYATACVKYGRFFLNGEEVVGYEKGYLGAYMQLVEHHVNTNYAANANHYDLWLDAIGINYLDGSSYGKGCNGAMRIAECIIYTNSLSHVERVKTAQYLSRKWLGKDIYYSDTDDTRHIASLGPVGETVDVSDGTTLGIGPVEGAGGIRKSGAGLLVIDDLAAGEVAVDGGELIVKSLSVSNTSAAARAWLHVDAADASTLTTYAQNGTNFVTAWNSLTENGQRLVRFVGVVDKDAFMRPNATNGLPMVDLGPALNGATKAKACALRVEMSDGSHYIHSNDYSDYVSTPYLQTIFIMHSSSGGGGALMGGYGNGYPYYSFPHDYTRTDSPVISLPSGDSRYGSSMTTLSNKFNNAAHVWRWNGGTDFNPFTQPFTGGCDLLAWRCSDGLGKRKMAELAIYGQGLSAAGGLAYGEVLLYNRLLTMHEFNAVEAYLLKKWLGKDTPGYRVARAGSLIVAPGAVVTVCDYTAARGRGAYTAGDGVIEVQSLGGGGTVNGKVKLLSGGGVTAVVGADGTVAGLVVNGEADLSAGGEVTFAGDVAKLCPGRYALVTAASAKFGEEWTCVPPSRSLSTTVRCVDNTLILNVAACGTMILFR